MKMTRFAAVVVVGVLTAGGSVLLAADMTLEGTVADAKCGAKHMMKDAAACTKDCIDKGSPYALVVGSKVYTLKTSTEKDKMELAKLAGKMAKVSGEIAGESVMVKSVAMGMEKKK